MVRRVLVTGGSGFIGTNLVQDLLESGSRVLSLDCTPPIHPGHADCFREIDILDAAAVDAAFREFRPEHVVHLAARTDLDQDTTLDDYRVNTSGTENILDSASRQDEVERVLVTSSMLVCRLGYVPDGDEDYAPTTRYGESKILTETQTRKRDLDATWALLRPMTIWGPWHLRLENEFWRVLRKGHYIHPSGKPCRRSYGFVGNSVYQIRRLLEAPREQVHRKTFYIGDPAIELLDYINGFSKGLTGRDVRMVPYPLMKAGAMLGDLLAAVGWKGVPLTSFRLSNMTQDNVLDVSPTLAVSGPNPFTLEQGIEQTVAWLKSR